MPLSEILLLIIFWGIIIFILSIVFRDKTRERIRSGELVKLKDGSIVSINTMDGMTISLTNEYSFIMYNLKRNPEYAAIRVKQLNLTHYVNQSQYKTQEEHKVQQYIDFLFQFINSHSKNYQTLKIEYPLFRDYLKRNGILAVSMFEY